MHVFHIVRFMHSDCERAAKHCTGDRGGLSPRAKFTTVEKKLNSLHPPSSTRNGDSWDVQFLGGGAR